MSLRQHTVLVNHWVRAFQSAEGRGKQGKEEEEASRFSDDRAGEQSWAACYTYDPAFGINPRGEKSLPEVASSHLSCFLVGSHLFVCLNRAVL